MPFSDYSTTAGSNSTASGVNIAEGCPPSNVNNAIRAVMADLRTAINPVMDSFLASTSLTQARTALGVSGGSTSNNNFAALTNSANKLPYMTGSDNWALATLTSFARTLLDDGDAATARTTLGVIGVTASSFTASGGYVKFSISGTTFTVQWVDGTANGETSTSVNYPTAFSSWSRAVCTGGTASPTAEQNNPFVQSTSTTAATLYNSREDTIAVTIWAWGV